MLHGPLGLHEIYGCEYGVFPAQVVNTFDVLMIHGFQFAFGKVSENHDDWVVLLRL